MLRHLDELDSMSDARRMQAIHGWAANQTLKARMALAVAYAFGLWAVGLLAYVLTTGGQ